MPDVPFAVVILGIWLWLGGAMSSGVDAVDLSGV